ncbi:hypothetical protein AMS68_007193 [Peltaster fructicola]|uniref:FAD-binding domain-containing protein n=1 Tax=Peltaster fructicola TaxID=286661 RepID=A0A6H0Y3Z2_9PEZI|nr:hypothetical protein AMS68_007193 [Peltaster fructicola]
MTKPVLIAGAGLGGLLFARALSRRGIPFKIYERDAHVNVRGQGYRIRISTDGINALKAVLTPEDYERLRRGTAQTGGGGIHNIDAITGEPEVKSDAANKNSDSNNKPKGGPGLGGDVLGVARGFLREELLRGFEDKVTWNKNVRGYKLQSDGVVAVFADGESEEGCMLVGADGLHSGVTKQLTDGKVRSYDTGARMIHGQTPARVFKDIGNGVFFLADHKSHPGYIGMITNVRPGVLENEPDTELGWVFVGSPGSFDAPNGDFSITGKPAADLSRELTQKWHPRLREILLQQNDAEAAFLKMSTASPDGVPEWKNEPRVTILGDAVHCMTPAGGVGANSALKDAEFLGRLIGEAGGFKEGITEAYEKEMRVYASENVKMSFKEASQRFSITDLK